MICLVEAGQVSPVYVSLESAPVQLVQLLSELDNNLWIIVDCEENV